MQANPKAPYRGRVRIVNLKIEKETEGIPAESHTMCGSRTAVSGKG